MARLCEFPGLAPLSGFGRQPKTPGRKVVSEQSEKQTTIETGWIRVAINPATPCFSLCTAFDPRREYSPVYRAGAVLGRGKKAGRPGREMRFRPDWPALNHLIRSATRSPICVQETFVMPSVKMSAVR